MGGLKDKFKQIDLLGNSYDLKYKNKSQYQTILGGFLSILVFTLISITTYIFIRNGFDTTSPDVSMSTSISDRLPKR